MLAACGGDDEEPEPEPPQPQPQPVNQPPTADAGEELTIDVGRSVTLDGSDSSDPENTQLGYSWRQTAGQPTVTLGDADDVRLVFTVPIVAVDATLTFELTVTDTDGRTGTDTVRVIVRSTGVLGIDDHEAAVRGVSISRAGHLAVSGDLDGTVRLWNANTGDAIRTLGSHDGAVYAVAINADGTHAISGGDDGTVRLWMWNETSGSEVRFDDGAGGTRSLGDKGVWVYAVALNKDGSRAASGGFDGKVRVWNTATTGTNAGGEITFPVSGNESRSLGSHGQHSVYGVSLSDDGSRALSGGTDRAARLWNVDTGEQVRSLTDDDGPMGVVFGVSLSGDGSVAVAGSADNHVHVWNAATGAEMHELEGHAADVSSVSLNEAKTRVLSAGGDGTVRFWNVDAGDTANNGEIRVLRQHTDYVWAASLSGDGAVALSGGSDGNLHLWNTSTQPEDTAGTFETKVPNTDPATAGDVYSQKLTGHTDSISGGVALSADGRRALSGSDDNTVQLWDTTTGELLHTMTGHTDWVSGVALNADGRIAMSASEDGTVRLWDATTGELLHTMTDHGDWANDVALSVDGRIAVSQGGDNTVRLWDTATGNLLRTMTGHTDHSIITASLSADGRLVLSGSDDGAVRLWDAATGELLRTMTGHTGWVHRVALSADGRFAISGGEDDTARLWDTTTGKHLRTLTSRKTDQDEFGLVTLSADGRLAMSGSDNTVLLWDATTGELLRTMAGHTDYTLATSLSADGRLAMSGSEDETVRLWRLGRPDDTFVPTAEVTATAAGPDCAGSPLLSPYLWTHAEQVVGFRNMDTVPNCTSAAIAQGTTSLTLRTAPTNLLSDFTYTVDGTSYTIDQAMERAYIAGIIVVKGGTILLERYGLGHNENSTWATGGATTPVLSMLIGAAIEDGHIDSVDDLVSEYVPRVGIAAYQGVTIRNLLQMASGVDWDEDSTSPTSDFAQAAELSGSALHNHLTGLERAATPGTRFNYNTGDANLLGDVLRAAIGDDDLSGYLSEKIWSPLMEHRATWSTRGGLEIGGCCINTSLRDLARIGWFARNDGVLPDGTRVLPQNWMRDSTTPAPAPPSNNVGYGYLWQLLSNNRYRAISLLRQRILVDPDNELVVAMQSAVPSGNTEAGRHSAQAFYTLAAYAAAVQEPSSSGTENRRTGRTLIW